MTHLSPLSKSKIFADSCHAFLPIPATSSTWSFYSPNVAAWIP